MKTKDPFIFIGEFRITNEETIKKASRFSLSCTCESHLPIKFREESLNRLIIENGVVPAARAPNKLVSLGKAMSGAPIISGINQFPNPPIITSITRKKIITKAWAVTITLYS